MNRKICLFLLGMIIIGCRQVKNTSSINAIELEAKKEAREDFISLANSYAEQGAIKNSVTAQVETTPIKAAKGDDAADDPAIWVNPTDPSKSLVYGSNKKGGLSVYDLSGNEVDYYPLGNINNVDIINNFSLGGRLITVLGCSNRSSQSIDLLEIKEDGTLKSITSRPQELDPMLIDDIYGFCFAKDETTDKAYSVINGKNGLLQQFEMLANGDFIDLELKRSIQFDSQTEGMVADNLFGYLYVGEEGRGVWKLQIDPSTKNKKTFLKNSGQSNRNISFDIEGMSIYQSGNTGYLIVSSQGNFSYAVFDRMEGNRYFGSFKISDGLNIDGVEETDGLAIVSDSLSVDFPNGVIVLQDGFNHDGDDLRAQNFKYVDWRALTNILKELDGRK
jgi:3-phytase